ncbi:hypothetical protein ACFXJ8_00495 [Nonomuraea sp. NPDC059194]|uniref:hypothetical protein n=1 Tax=Nonomuraea sp. NPDC059194 TaxID=3346764 RepID=UPI0036C111A4
MKTVVATLGIALFALVGLVTPAHAASTPAYACIIVNLSDNGTLEGLHCRPAESAPATGPITGPFAVWSPFQLTRIIVCTSGYANTPAGITGSGCHRIF